MWTKQRTRQGDTLSSLARDYNTSVEKILAANSIEVRPSDRYLSQQAQAYMLPTNLPRPKLAKLVRERDIHKWVRSIGGECDAIREGSQTQTLRFLSCAPGAYCRFTADTAINLPARKRIATLAGLGAVSVMDTVGYLNSLKQWAKDFGDYVVKNANTNEENVDSWRDGFIAGMNGKINVATRADSSGVPAFVRDARLIQKVADYATAKTEEAKQFNRSLAARFSSMVAQVQAGVAASIRSVADSIQSPTPTPPVDAAGATKAPGKEAPAKASKNTRAGTSAGGTFRRTFRPTTTTLDMVRQGRATLARGQSGPAVREAQALLKVSTDSLFGSQTENAVKGVQTSSQLPVTGILDQDTLRALESPVLAPTTEVAKDNTMLYVGIGAAVLVIAAFVAKRRKAA